jgi:hypothetical protein
MNEDWDDMAAAEPLAGEELERLMARYARVRLEPSPAQSKRARAALMEAAWRRRIDPGDTISAHGRRWPARRAPFAGWSMRRVGMAMSAAVLAGLMIGTSVFAASRAGGPLYETRVALETLTLPAEASAHVDAQLQRAQERLAEAVEAAGRHDDRATAAALDAYDTTINDLDALEGGPAARALEAVLHHREILLGIAAGAPAGAANGLARAIETSDRVIQALATPGPGTGAGGDNGVGSGPGNAGVGAPGANPTAQPVEPTARPAKTPAPTATAKPAKTPAPTATAKPAKTPAPAATPEPTQKPGKTPPPRKTPDPGKPEEGARQPAPTARP